MVSSVQPAAYTPLPGAPPTGRPNNAPADAGGRADNIDVGYRGEIASAREGLAAASSSLDLALASGRDAANIVSQMRDLARAAAGGDDAARAGADQTFQALKQRYSQVVGGAIDAGATVLGGEAFTVQVDPDAPPVTVQGYDLRLKAQPGAEDVLRLTSDTSVADASSSAVAARDADASLARIDTALSRLSGAAQKLSAHDGFLGALDAAVAKSVTPDLDAEGARLTALQVRQTLAGANTGIANSAPSSVLALFRE